MKSFTMTSVFFIGTGWLREAAPSYDDEEEEEAMPPAADRCTIPLPGVHMSPIM
jgi:hypothetical protein